MMGDVRAVGELAFTFNILHLQRSLRRYQPHLRQGEQTHPGKNKKLHGVEIMFKDYNAC